MNRFKKELQKRGYLLENDYPWLPFNETQAIKVDSESATYSVVKTSVVVTFQFDRDFSPEGSVS
jgi:hypothetical protein